MRSQAADGIGRGGQSRFSDHPMSRQREEPIGQVYRIPKRPLTFDLDGDARQIGQHLQGGFRARRGYAAGPLCSDARQWARLALGNLCTGVLA